MEGEWKAFHEAVLRSAKEVLGLRKLGGGRSIMDSQWWNDEVNQLVREEKRRHKSTICREG